MTAGIDFDPAEREAIAAEVNLSVLRRSDSAVKSILKSASHVALYELKDDSSWRRCDIEGSLFIVERRPDAQGSAHRLVIFNRKSLHNYTDDLIIGNEKVEQTDQMIMYRNSHGATVGIWFYETDEAAATFAILQKILNGEHVPAEIASKPKRVMKRPQSVQQKAPIPKTTPQKSPQKGPPKGSTTRPVAQKGPAKRGPGHRGSYKGAPHKDPVVKDAQKDQVQKGQSQKEQVKPKTIMVKQPKKTSPSQVSRNASESSTSENPLKQIFPNLQLPDGINEHPPSDSAQQLSPVEAEQATTFKPTAEIDGAILRASETELPEKALREPLPEKPAVKAEVSKESNGGESTTTNPPRGAPKGVSAGKRVEEPRKESSKVAKEPTPIVQPAQVMRAIQSVEPATGTDQPQKQPKQIQIKKRPKENPSSSADRTIGAPVPKASSKPEMRSVQERNSTERPAPPPLKSSQAAATSHDAEEAGRRMHAAVHDGRYRDMPPFRFNPSSDVAVSAPVPMMGNAISAGIPAPGTQPLAPGHFPPGVHPQLAMMMHQHQYQMYMQQQQYLANVHQRQLQNQNLSQSQQQQQQQRYFEHMQELQRQAQQAHQQQLSAHRVDVVGGRGGNVDGRVKNEVESAQDLMRMLRVGEATEGVNPQKAVGRAQDPRESAPSIGRGVATAERLGQVGSSGTTKLDRSSFRAVVQRMLTDRKLFDCVYEHYLATDQ